ERRADAELRAGRAAERQPGAAPGAELGRAAPAADAGAADEGAGGGGPAHPDRAGAWDRRKGGAHLRVRVAAGRGAGRGGGGGGGLRGPSVRIMLPGVSCPTSRCPRRVTPRRRALTGRRSLLRARLLPSRPRPPARATGRSACTPAAGWARSTSPA